MGIFWLVFSLAAFAGLLLWNRYSIYRLRERISAVEEQLAKR